MLTTRERARNERGVTLVLFALTVVVLMLFVAFVVDLGPVYNERRQAVTAADGGALAGAQNLNYGNTKASTEAMLLVRQNLRTKYTDAAWKTAWTSCSDGDPNYPVLGRPLDPTSPAGTIITKCITFNSAMTRVRVRVPDQVVATSFARVIGITSLKTSAIAEAQIGFPGPGAVLPFAELNTGGAGEEKCLKASSGGTTGTAPCDGPVTGNFGSLDVPLYGNAQVGTTEKCNGDPNGRLVNNMIVGIDHQLDEWRGPDENPPEPAEGKRLDDVAPGCVVVERPNELLTQTGIGSNLQNGMIDGTAPYSGGPARLKRSSPTFATRTVIGQAGLDDKPLWEFIDPSLTAAQIPSSCVASSFVGANASKAHLLQCFADYNTGGYSVPMFTRDDISPGDGTYDIQLSSRLSFVPEFHESDFTDDCTPGGATTHCIKAFRAAFIQTAYFGCNGTGCAITWNPGEGGSSSLGSGENLDAITALLFKNSMLPAAIIDNGPGGSLIGARPSLIK